MAIPYSLCHPGWRDLQPRTGGDGLLLSIGIHLPKHLLPNNRRMTQALPAQRSITWTFFCVCNTGDGTGEGLIHPKQMLSLGATLTGLVGMFSYQGCDVAQRNTQPSTSQKLPLPSENVSCGFILFTPDGPDDPVISPQESYFRAGTFLRLSCDADSNPPAQYSWLVNGSFLQPTQELFIPNISENDTGSYTCLVSNLASGLNKSSVKDITVTGKWTLDR